MTDISNFNAKLGSALRAEREKKGYSLRYMQIRLGKTYATISRWETGDVTMTAEAFMNYLDVLDVNPDAFIKKFMKDNGKLF